MIYEVSFSGFLHSLEIVVICVLLTLAEFLAVALLVAPRAVARKLLSPVRALARPARRIFVIAPLVVIGAIMSTKTTSAPSR